MSAGNPTPTRPLRVLMITSEWPSDPGHTAHFIARQARFLRAAGIDVDVCPFRGGGNPFRYLRAWARVRMKLARNSYDLVHAQFGQSGLLALPKSIPLVVTFRGDDLFGMRDANGTHTFAGRLLPRLSRLVAHRADATILVAEHLKQYLNNGHAPVHIIPSGIDFDLFQCMPAHEARRRLGLPPETTLILFVGDPADPRKRFGLAEQAVELLNRTRPARLVIGWGVPHDDMPLYLNACDALVFTSRLEGSPNAVKEALACDLPVVSVAVADVAERLQGIPGCETCADERPETIAAALERSIARKARSPGREAVRALDEHVLTERVIGIYRSVVRSVNRN